MTAKEVSPQIANESFMDLSETSRSTPVPPTTNSSTIRVCGCISVAGIVLVGLFVVALVAVTRFVRNEMEEQAVAEQAEAELRTKNAEELRERLEREPEVRNERSPDSR
jgi:hypothetical protein